MEPSEPDVFVDHKEITLDVPSPRQLTASKVEIKPTQEEQTTDKAESEAPSPRQSTSSKVEIKPSDEEQTTHKATTEVRVTTQMESELASSTIPEDPAIIQNSSQTTESATKAATKTTVQKHVTTIYTQRLSGRSSKSSDSGGSDVTSPTENVDMNAPVFGFGKQSPLQSPTEVCKVQFQVRGDVAANTTTAFTKVFTKTVDTTEEITSPTNERHLSQFSFSVGGGKSPFKDQEMEGSSQATLFKQADANRIQDALLPPVKPEEEKEVSDYSPGLAIRSLTLEDLREKRTTPERDAVQSSGGQATEMSSTSLFPSSSSTQSSFMASSSSLSEKHATAPPGSAESATSFLSSQSSTASFGSSATGLTSGGQAFAQCTEQSAAALRKPLFNPIEVERKFTIGPDTEQTLRSLGARLHKEKTFTDVYYDREDYSLIVSDCWIRRRNQRWEAKIPLQSQNPKALFAPASQYREVSEEKEISAWLVERLGLDRWMRGDPMDLLVQAAGLVEFARFSTTRRSYALPSCTVDLDLTDHGFRVGEIEVMAASPEEVPQALETICNVAQQLGLSPLTLL